MGERLNGIQEVDGSIPFSSTKLHMFERITFTPEIMGGRACIRGMRITVAVIVGQVAHGASFEEVLEGYPDLERADVEQAVEYAAWVTQEEIYNV